MKLFENRPSLCEEDLSLWHRLYAGERAAFIDIETTGLNKAYDCIYQVGLLFEDENGPKLVQLLAENAGDERELLRSFGELLRGITCLISFNGDAFDLPYLAYRAQKLRLKAFPRLIADELHPADLASVDLLREFRPVQRLFGWENCRLKTLERFLGTEREDPFTGAQLIELFDEYSATGDLRLEQVLRLHNYEDVADMPQLLRIEGFLAGLREARVRGLAVQEGQFTLNLAEALPLSLSFCRGGLRVRTEAGSTKLSLIPEYEEASLRYYLPNYKDYYFLPETAELVHRALAETAPSCGRRPARREECYLVREGRFLMLPREQGEALERIAAGELRPLHLFRHDLKEKNAYLEEGELSLFLREQPEEALNAWIQALI